MSAKISKSSFNFLKELQKNNNRDWFQANKSKYEAAKENLSEFGDNIIAELIKTDDIETLSGKKALYRIYRDIRFSKDKTPYKEHFGLSFLRATKSRRGSYFMHIKNGGENLVGGGFYGPNSADLALIRSHIAAEPERLRKILKSKKFKDTFGTLQGEQLKSAPRGYSVDHPAIDLLRYKQLYVFRRFTDKEVLQDDFQKEVMKTYKAIRPFFDYMSEILTTNLNGESLI